MRKTRTLAVVLGVCALGCVITCSPYGDGAFTCAGDASCTGGTHGVCESNGVCSFADPSCGPGGQRYDSGDCVSPTAPPVDAAITPSVDAPASTDGASVDGPVETRFCLGASVTVCLPTTPNAPVSLAATIDTAVGSAACRADVTDASGAPITSYCVIAGSTITGSTVAQGTRPLVLLAATTMALGTIDAASHRGGSTGPGANAASCIAPGVVTAGGGGGGGGFGTKGGDGGNGGAGGTGGTGGAVSPATTLHGGCPGRDGTTAATHGSGGGAVLLLATGTIAITGAINASGASAASAGAILQAGASGAGSGGLILIEAPTIQNNGVVFANGGAGAEGSGAGGNPGKEGTDATGIAAAIGGAGQSGTGGDGGDGGAKPPPGNGDGGKGGNGAGGGGGGGGGGVGIIRTHGGTLGGSASPAPTTY